MFRDNKVFRVISIRSSNNIKLYKEREFIKIMKEKREMRKKCSKCESKLVYLRLKDKMLVCRSCGNIEKFNGKEIK